MSLQLYDYQRIGSEFLQSKNALILGDDLGLGKTAQAIDAVKTLHAKTIVVICPNTVKMVWEREIAKWSVDDKVYVLTGSSKRRTELIEDFFSQEPISYTITMGDEATTHTIACQRKWLILNYELLLWHEGLYGKQVDVLIVDEAHRIKNRKTKCSILTKALRQSAERCYLLTGSPIMNHPEEIWSLLNCLDKSRFKSYWAFVEYFCYVGMNPWFHYWEVRGMNMERIPMFQQILDEYMLRREKKDVLPELPEKVVEYLYVDMTEKQRALYRQMRYEMMAELPDEEEWIMAPTVIAQLVRLKQFAISPEILGFSVPGGKIEEAVDFITHYCRNGNKLVVFSQFLTALKILEQKLDVAKIPYVEVSGEVPYKNRKEIVNAFQGGDTKLILLTTQVGREGIDLFAAHTVLFLDHLWVPALNRQAEDRLHRIGQKNAVTVVVLVTKDTIDEYIEDTLLSKDTLINKVLRGKIQTKHWKEFLRTHGEVYKNKSL